LQNKIENVFISSEVSSLIKIYPRGSTTMLESYLTPAI